MGLFSRAKPTAEGADPRAAAPDFTALFNAHVDFVWRSVRRLGVPESGADDATQQVFVIAQQKLASIAVGHERAFLFRVAINVASHARRAAARRREVLGEDEEALVSGAPAQDVALDRMRARVLLDQVLDAMTLELRTVFVLCELEEMTMADVAEALDLPPGTVASRLRRAREEFHDHAKRARLRSERIATRRPDLRASQPSIEADPSIREAAR